jgi:hypothetical protein
MEQDKSTVKKRHSRALHKKPGALLLMLGLVIIGGTLAALLFLPKGERVNAGGYQVVYMTSGQAYFGKLKNTAGDYLVLDTPYTAQDVKPEGQEDAQASTTLVKVSQQQYGPEEAMSLKADQVLFWQNLRDDSKVTQAIKNAN